MVKIISQNEMKLKFIQDITDGVLGSTSVMNSDLHERMYIATLELTRKICYADDVVPLLGVVQKIWLGKNEIIIKDSPSLNPELKAVLSDRERKP